MEEAENKKIQTIGRQTSKKVDQAKKQDESMQKKRKEDYYDKT